MQTSHIESEIARLLARLQGASIADARTLRRRISDLKELLARERSRERSVDE